MREQIWREAPSDVQTHLHGLKPGVEQKHRTKFSVKATTVMITRKHQRNPLRGRTLFFLSLAALCLHLLPSGRQGALRILSVEDKDPCKASASASPLPGAGPLFQACAPREAFSRVQLCPQYYYSIPTMGHNLGSRCELLFYLP